jgi:glycosyltransferase involved in cell wall biosynthesis
MKVAFVCQHFDVVLPPVQNSVGIWTYEVARRLSAECDTTIVARRSRGGPAQIQVEGIRMELLTCAPERLWGRASRMWGRIWQGAPLFTRSFYAFDYLLQAMQKIRRMQPDVIHIQNFPHYAPALRRAAPKAAIVLHMHCDWLTQLDREGMARAVAASDLVVGCSGHVVASAHARFANLDVTFAVLPNGAPADRLACVAAPSTAGKVLFVGRVSPEKGIHTLLEAWPKVVAAFPEAHLDIVGPPAVTPREFLIDLSQDPDVLGLSRFYPGGNAFKGSYDAALRAMMPSHLDHTVTFTGSLPYERIMEQYAAASLLVNPSLSESFGMSLVEALATETPVVATRAGGMPEIVEATGGGILVEKNDPSALSQAIIRLLANPQASAEMGRRGARRVAELYSWSRVAALTRELHEQALSARRSRRLVAA